MKHLAQTGLTLGLWLASVGCGAAGAPAPTAAAAERPSEDPAPPRAKPPAPLSPAESALQAKLARALEYVSEVRGLNKRHEVTGKLISREAIAAYVREQIDDGAPADVLAANEALLFGFGNVEATFDYRETVIGLMTSQLLGFYDPKQKAFFVSGDLSGDEADATLWHELVHALQDQHYDLTHLTDWQPDQGDRQAAVHALAEGDATSTMLDAMLKPRGSTALDLPEGMLRAESVLGSGALAAPPVLVRSLIAPYVDGLAFANFMRRRGGFAAVDEAWRSPPVSTEQLLHPEKYLSQEAPLVVATPPGPAFASELKERFHDVMGEQSLRLLLEDWLPARTAAQAASDWGGDRLAAFSDEARKRWAIAWHIQFDTAAAAERALLAFARSAPLTDKGIQALPPVPPPALTKVKGDKMCRPRHTRGPMALVRRGAELVVTVGPFERNAVAVTPDPACSVVLGWAEQILKR